MWWTQWLILSFHKLKNMVKFSKEFLFVIIKRINKQISTFCHFCHQKKEFDAILIYGTRMMRLTTDAFQIPKSRKYNHMQFRVVPQNDIKFCLRCWSQIRWNVQICMLIRSIITNIKSLWNFTMFFNLWKDRNKISQYSVCKWTTYTNCIKKFYMIQDWIVNKNCL